MHFQCPTLTPSYFRAQKRALPDHHWLRSPPPPHTHTHFSRNQGKYAKSANVNKKNKKIHCFIFHMWSEAKHVVIYVYIVDIFTYVMYYILQRLVTNDEIVNLEPEGHYLGVNNTS